MERFDTTVLIVGAGPVGLTTAILLDRLGIPHRLIERRSGPQRAPAAHVVNARTFEILRQAGVDMEKVDELAIDPADGGFVHWVTQLGGEVLGSLPFERQGDDVLSLTPTPLRNLSQHRLEPLLAASLDRARASAPAYGHVWEAAEERDGVIVSRLRDLARDEPYEVASRYLIAADGAGSRVRKWLGIQPVGPDRLQSFLMIHFRANLRRLVGAHRGVLFWICDPESFGTLVAHDIDREWVYMKAFDPERESADDYPERVCEAIVRRTLADPTVDLQIATIGTWHMTAQVAERYRHGNAFLVGDAAHRFPPTGGLGLNSGVQDAHNLAWKIAAVERGVAAPALLDTYEVERRAVAQQNADQSLSNAMRLFEVPVALGLSADVAASRERMREVLADPEGRARVAAAIANQAEHFDMLGLQLGFVYDSGALVAATAAPAEAESSVRVYHPSSRPGARLPHGWVERDGRRISTLDLVPLDRPVLLVGPAGEAWLAAASEIRRKVAHGAADAVVSDALAILRVGHDFADPGGWWASVARMSPEGAILVRPDQHVGFRSAGLAADVTAALSGALGAIHAHPDPALGRG